MANHEIKVKATIDKQAVMNEWQSMISKMNKEEIKMNTNSAVSSIDKLQKSLEKLGNTKLTSIEKVTKQLETFSNSMKQLNSIKTTSFDSLNTKFEKLNTSLNSLNKIDFESLKTANSALTKLSKTMESLTSVNSNKMNDLNKSMKQTGNVASGFNTDLTNSFKNMGTSFSIVTKQLEKISTFTKRDFNKLAQMSDVIGNSLKKMFSGGNQEQFINNIKTVTNYLEQLSRLDVNIARRIFGENLGTQAQTTGNALKQINSLLRERESLLKQISTTTDSQSQTVLLTQLKNVDSELAKLGQSYKSTGQMGEHMIQTMAKNFQTAQEKMIGLERDLNKGFKLSGGSDQSQAKLKELQSEFEQVRTKYGTLVKDLESNPIKVMNSKEFSSLFTDIANLQNKLKDLKININNENQVSKMKSDVSGLEQELSRAKQLMTGLKLNVDSTKLEKARTLMRELSQIRITPQSTSEEITNYVNKYNEAKVAVKALSQEVDNLSKHRKIDLNIDTLISQLSRLKGQSEGADKEIDDLVASLHKLKTEGNIEIKTKSFGTIKQQATQVRSALAGAQQSIRHTGKLWNTLANTLSTITPMYTLSTAITGMFSGSLEKIKEVDNALRDLQKVAPPSFSGTTEALEEVRQKAVEVGKTVAASSTDVINSTAAALQLGIKDMDKAMEYARNSTVYANVSDQSQDMADKQLKSILSAYGGVNKALQKNGKLVKGAGKDYNEMTNYIDMANFAGNNFALTSGDVGVALQQSASSFKTLGVDLSEGISYIVGAQESVQNASKVGNAFKTISANLAGIKTSAKTGETSLNKTAVALEKLGIKVKDDNGNIRDMSDILNDLGSKWKDLNTTQKSGIAEAIAGKNHINTLQALMNNWDTVLEYQKQYNAGMMVGSAEKENERYINSIEGKMTLLKENITQLVTTVMSTDMFKNLLDGANSFLETVNKIMKSLNEMPGLLQATVGGGAIALYQGLQQKGAGENVTGYWTKMANWYKQAAQNGEQLNTTNTRITTSMGSVNTAIQRYNSNASRTSSTTAQASQMLQRMGTSAGTINTNVSNASQGLSVFNQNANNTGNVLNQSERQISVFTQGMQSASENTNEAGQNINTVGQAASNSTSRLGGMKNVLRTVGQNALGVAKGFLTMVGNMALLSAGIFVIEQVASAVYKLANANKLAYQSAQDRISETESTVAGYRQQISSLTSISERYDELNKKTSKTKDEESELLSLRQQIAEISPDLVIGWDDENQPLLALNGSLKDYIENLKEVQKIERTKKASQENTAGRLALNEIKKANETSHDRLQPGFDFTNESQIMQTKYFGAQIKSLQQYSENYNRILEERNKQVSKKNEDLAENYDKMSEYIQSAQTLALNRLNDSGIYKNWSEMSDKISGSMYTLFNEFDWSSKYVDTQSEQNKFLEGFNKIAEYAEKNKSKVEDWTKTINAAQQAYQLTGDADAFADSIGGIADQLEKVTGIDASQWVETLRGTLEGALDEEQMRLADYLKNNGSSLTDYLQGDEKAVELHAKWVADNTLADLLNDQDVTNDEKKVQIRAYAEGELQYEGSSEVQRLMKAVLKNDGKIDDVELGIVTKITSSEARGGGLSGEDSDLLNKILKGEAVDADIKTDIVMSDGTVIAREELQKMNEEAKQHPIELQTKLNKEETEKAIKEVTDDKDHREILMSIKTEFRDKDQVQDFDNLITNLQGDKSNIEAVINANVEGLSECETYEEMISWLIDNNVITTECGVTILGKDDVTSLTESLKELKVDDNINAKITADVQRGDLDTLQSDINSLPEEKRMKVVAAVQEALGNLDTVEGKTLHDKTLQVTQNGAGEVVFKLAEVDSKTENKTKHVDVSESGADETKQKMQEIQDQPSSKNVVVNFIQSGWDYIQGLFSKLSSGLQSTIEDGIPMFDGISVNPFDTESPISDHIFKATALDMPDTSAIDSFTADATSGISKSIGSFSSFKTKDIPINVALYGVSSIKNGIELMTTLNNQLSKVEHNVSLANAKLDNLFGKKRISTLQSMNKSLQEQQRLLKQQYSYQTKEASKLQKVLSNTYGFKFNDDGNVTNYLKKLTQMETKLKQLEKTSEKASKSASKTTKSSSTKDTSKMTKSQKAAYKKQQEAIKKQAEADKTARKTAADTAKNNYDKYKDSYEQAKTYLEKYMKLQFDDIGSTKEEFEKLKTQIRENNDEIEKLKFDDKIYKYVNAVEMLNSKFETLGDILDGLDTKLDMSHGQKSLDIMNKQLKYMAEQKKYLESSLGKETKESNEYSKKLKEYGFKFDKLGNISNEDSILNKHQNSADLDKIKEYVDGYKDVHNNLQKTKNDILDIEKSIKDTNESLSLAKLEQSTYKTKNAITSTDKSISKLEDDLDTLDTKLNYAYGTDRLDLLNKKQETYNKLIGETNKNLSNYKKEQSAYQKELEKYGFKFDKNGEMTNFTDAMNKLQNSGSYEYVSDLIDTWNDLTDSINDSKQSIDDYNDSIKKANEDRLNTTKDIEDKITSMYQDQLDKRKEQLQKQADKEVDIINKVKDAYNDKKDEDDYNEQLKEQQDKIAKINQDIELAKRDTSLSGRAKLESLMEELADENKNLQDIVKDRQDELMDKMFDNAIDNVNNSNDKALEDLEKTWDDAKIAEMVKNALGSGVFEDIDGNLTNLQDAMIKFAEESGEAFGVMGESIKNDYIANLQIAYDTIKNIDSIYSNLGLKPNDDIQAGVANDDLSKTINVGGIEIEISGAGANATDIANEVKTQLEVYMSNIINRV